MILIDTSAWIDSFRGGNSKNILKELLHNGQACINDIILAELLPSIKQRRELELETLLRALPKFQVFIDWNELITMQAYNLRHGINRVGLPDLMIAQNAMQNNVTLFSLDKHFSLMSKIMPIRMYEV